MSVTLTAIAMAIWLSVTVSIGDDMIGVFSVIVFDNDDIKSYTQRHIVIILHTCARYSR